MQERLRKLRRWMKYKYMMLIRAKGGASMVAMGFAIGIAVEMFTLPTLGFAFVLIFPLVYLFKGNLPAALVGFVVGKVIYLPMAILNTMVGAWVLPSHMSIHLPWMWVNKLLLANLKLIVGGVINGILLGAVCYYPIKLSIEAYKNKRREKRKLRHSTRLDTRPAAE
ncbi:DUF2062 domain-containing protein [Cohnella faecalis]|nr:DUF2062 domain-containing protein [Cohnella faecalis]